MGFLADDTRKEGRTNAWTASQALAKKTKARRVFVCYSILNPDAVHDDDEVFFFSETVANVKNSHPVEELAILRRYVDEYISRPPHLDGSIKINQKGE